MKTHEELRIEFVEKWGIDYVDNGVFAGYMSNPDAKRQCLADLNVLFDKLMPTEEDFNKAVKVNLPLLIKSTKGKLQYPYVSGHAHAEIEKQLGHELYLWFRNLMKGDNR